jgi:hypothetical protein
MTQYDNEAIAPPKLRKAADLKHIQVVLYTERIKQAYMYMLYRGMEKMEKQWFG